MSLNSSDWSSQNLKTIELWRLWSRRTWSPGRSRRRCSSSASAQELWQNGGFSSTHLCPSHKPLLGCSTQFSSFSQASCSSLRLDSHQVCLQVPSSSRTVRKSRRSPIGWLSQRSWLLVVALSEKGKGCGSDGMWHLLVMISPSQIILFHGKRIWLQGYLDFCAGAATDEGLGGSLYEWELVCNLPWTSLVNGDKRRIVLFPMLLFKSWPVKNTCVHCAVTQTWYLSKKLRDRCFGSKNFTQKTRKSRH